LDVHWHQRALAVVYRQPRGALELSKQRAEAPRRANVGPEDQEGVVRVLEHGAGTTVHQRVLEDSVTTDQALQNVGDDEEEVGDRGSPWRSPRMHRIHRPGTPLRRTAEREEMKMSSSQSHQMVGKPHASITARRLDQLTESKALAKSSLRTTTGVFRR
jgi:hypothetical protein